MIELVCLDAIRERIPEMTSQMCTHLRQTARPALEGAQDLQLHFLRWTPSAHPLKTRSRTRERLDDAARRLLETSGLRGDVELVGSGGVLEGPERAQALILLSCPVTKPVALPQPRGTRIVYLQTAVGFERIPADAPTLARTIELSPSTTTPAVTTYQVHQADGATSGGSAMSWDPREVSARCTPSAGEWPGSSSSSSSATPAAPKEKPPESGGFPHAP
jgi:hypothetical protein